jgi:hypothetical protein
MDLIEYVRANLADAHRMLGIAMQDLSEDVAHWQPPGTANTIGALLAHMVTGEDLAFNRQIKDGTLIFDAGDWASKTGIPADRKIWTPGWRLNVEAFDEYRLAVEENAKAGLDALTPADFEREVEWYNGMRPIGGVLRTSVIHHILGHSGEISSLKGAQGLKGLPF